MEIIARKINFVLFINTKSGNADGKTFFTLGSQQLTIRYEDFTIAHLHLIDLFDKSSKFEGLNLVKNFLVNSTDFRVIICGGDGTIPWVLSQLLSEGLNLTQIIFGIIPIGTGNDFSRSIGWGSETVKVSKLNMDPLSCLVKQFMNATIGFYDMWDVTVETFEDGKIYDIKNQQEILRTEKSFQKMFTNYVGIGLDARVVYTVQRHRTPFAFLNKVVYGLIGFCFLFKCMTKLDQKVESITQNPDEEMIEQDKKVPLLQKQQKLTIEVQQQKFPLKSGRCGIVFLNCTSYMAGLRKVWQTKSIGNVNIKKSKGKEYFKQQKVDDGKIELVSFRNELNLALERLVRSGEKVLQGSGPFEVKMKKPRRDEVTHMQINGESIKVINLKSVFIKKTRFISDHKLRVLVNSQFI